MGKFCKSDIFFSDENVKHVMIPLGSDTSLSSESKGGKIKNYMS